MRERLIEIGETLLGGAWWAFTYVWGLLVAAAMLGTPLVLANLVVAILDGFSATQALAVGVVGAFALGLPPWDAAEDERLSLALVVAGSAGSVIVWQAMRGGADLGSLLLAVTLAGAGWAIRRALANRTSPSTS